MADLAGRTSEQGKDYLIGLNFAKYKNTGCFFNWYPPPPKKSKYKKVNLG